MASAMRIANSGPVAVCLGESARILTRRHVHAGAQSDRGRSCVMPDAKTAAALPQMSPGDAWLWPGAGITRREEEQVLGGDAADHCRGEFLG